MACRREALFFELNRWPTVGAFVLGLSQLLCAYIAWKAVRGGAKASGQVWNGAHRLEWTLPRQRRTFATPPAIK